MYCRYRLWTCSAPLSLASAFAFLEFPLYQQFAPRTRIEPHVHNRVLRRPMLLFTPASLLNTIATSPVSASRSLPWGRRNLPEAGKYVVCVCVSRVLGANNSDPKPPLHHSHHAWAHTAICQHSCLSPQCCCLAPRHIQRLWSSPPPNLHSTNSGAGWKCYCRPQHGPILWHPRPGKFRRPQKLFEWNAFNDCHRYPNISKPSMWVHSQPIFHTHSQIATLHKITRPYAPSVLLPVRSKQFWHPNH